MRWRGRLIGVALALAVPTAAAADAGAVAAGARLYATECAPCHGADRSGHGPDAAIFMPRPRPLDAAFVSRYDDAQLVAAIRNGAALPLALDVEATKRRLGEVDLLVAHLRRLPTIDWDAYARGRTVFLRRCAGCHGPLGDPGVLVATGGAKRPLADQEFATKPPAELRRLVRHDAPGLPPLDPPLTDAEAAAVAGFVHELTPGFVLYARFCASCHGLDGRADDVVDPGNAPKVKFDRAWNRQVDSEKLHVTVWHMLGGQRPAMPHFRTRLSDDDARAIVAWLRSSATAPR